VCGWVCVCVGGDVLMTHQVGLLLTLLHDWSSLKSVTILTGWHASEEHARSLALATSLAALPERQHSGPSLTLQCWGYGPQPRQPTCAQVPHASTPGLTIRGQRFGPPEPPTSPAAAADVQRTRCDAA
jgi:hypothetical protein